MTKHLERDLHLMVLVRHLFQEDNVEKLLTKPSRLVKFRDSHCKVIIVIFSNRYLQSHIML